MAAVVTAWSGIPTSAPAWPTVVRPVRIGNWPVMKGRAARRAARLRVIVGEKHAFLGQLIQVRRLPGHHAAMIGADVPDADVVPHDDDDVRFFSGRLWGRLCVNGENAHQHEAERCDEEFCFHSG